jgi:hypothetical protein
LCIKANLVEARIGNQRKAQKSLGGDKYYMFIHSFAHSGSSREVLKTQYRNIHMNEYQVEHMYTKGIGERQTMSNRK